MAWKRFSMHRRDRYGADKSFFFFFWKPCAPIYNLSSFFVGFFSSPRTLDIRPRNPFYALLVSLLFELRDETRRTFTFIVDIFFAESRASWEKDLMNKTRKEKKEGKILEA